MRQNTHIETDSGKEEMQPSDNMIGREIRLYDAETLALERILLDNSMAENPRGLRFACNIWYIQNNNVTYELSL